MPDGWTSVESLEHELSWRWPLSFNRVEELPDGTVAGVFSGSYRGVKTIFYELTIIFHPHPYGDGLVQWRFGAMHFNKRQLPTAYKKEIRQQYATILKNHQWPEEKRSPYAG